MRLSRDDENYGDSVSIETQRTILRKYAQDNGLNVVGEYVDDGWSGTNFERPNFQRMMDDVEAGKVNCIATKDLSRFGREHVMMDYYLEFVFPEKQIRYIAVTENEDTEKGLSDFVPFKNLFNEWFAKDTSRKVKTALHAKFAEGQRIFAYAPLGYIRHPEIKNTLAVDSETKWIIEKIFDLAVHGAGAAKITKILTAEKVPTAGYLNFIRYGTFANIYAGAPEEKSYAWTIAQVKSILKDETYIGNSIHNRETNISYKNKRRIRKPQEEWFRVENTHEAIISKDVFNQVQDQIAGRRRQMKDATTQIFAGLVRCADCGWSMSFGTNRGNSRPFSYFNCTNYRQLGKNGGRCTAHYVRYDTLYAYVLSRIQYWAGQAELGEEQLLERLLKTGDKGRAAQTKKQAAELAKAEKRKAEVDRLFAKMYEDWTAERITGYNFNMLSQKYQAEQSELIDKIDRIKAELATERQTASDAEKWVALIKQYSHPTELTAELLNTLIEKIVIHEATKDADGMREQEIEIYYRFVGKID
ncbi:MAG: recombinase family protein [Lachnospiraceae bacterium]|nr:recombinase family protein [Lachnospiraceae bacterium]